MIANDEREPMPSRFINSVHNALASQVAIELGAHSLNSAPTAREISFETALWQGIQQLNGSEADSALVGAADELNKYVLFIGNRWRRETNGMPRGEGATVANLTRAQDAREPLAHVAAVRFGRYRLPFDPEREAAWVAEAADLSQVDVVLSGAKGLPALDPMYENIVAALSSRTGRPLKHQTYKHVCGEYYSASAFGFSVAVDLVRNGSRGVLLYTLSASGAKAASFVVP
jgi:acyl transferase domain-containing protein